MLAKVEVMSMTKCITVLFIDVKYSMALASVLSIVWLAISGFIMLPDSERMGIFNPGVELKSSRGAGALPCFLF